MLAVLFKRRISKVLTDLASLSACVLLPPAKCFVSWLFFAFSERTPLFSLSLKDQSLMVSGDEILQDFLPIAIDRLLSVRGLLFGAGEMLSQLHRPCVRHESYFSRNLKEARTRGGEWGISGEDAKFCIPSADSH